MRYSTSLIEHGEECDYDRIWGIWGINEERKKELKNTKKIDHTGDRTWERNEESEKELKNWRIEESEKELKNWRKRERIKEMKKDREKELKNTQNIDQSGDRTRERIEEHSKYRSVGR